MAPGPSLARAGAHRRPPQRQEHPAEHGGEVLRPEAVEPGGFEVEDDRRSAELTPDLLGLPSVAQTGRLVEYLQDAWLVLAVPRFSPSLRRRLTSPPKYYAVDTGLAAASSPNPTPDLGRKLENAVLLALRRRGASPAFAAAPHEWECDFVTKDLAIQCCARLTPENRERELRGLDQAADLPGRAGKRNLLIVSLDQEDSLMEGGRRIRVVPAWKWLD